MAPTRSRVWSTSSPRSARAASSHRRSSAATNKNDGFTQNYQLSWGNGGRRPATGGRRRRLHQTEGYFSPVTARFRLSRRLMSTACLPGTGGCSSFLPNGRYIGAIFPNGGDETLISAPRIRQRSRISATLSAADPVTTVSTSLLTITCRSRSSGMAVFGNLKYDITPDLHFSR